MRDTTRRAARQQQTSAGSIARSSRGANRLSRDQTTQLQTALQQMGCDPGAIDGRMGSHTERAMRCARQKSNITSNDPNALYHSLNLNFARPDTGTTGRRAQTSRADSTRRPMRPDSTRRP
jgi:peptidoglycan hydrolase-like protein with peptidoglycan-binding domain